VTRASRCYPQLYEPRYERGMTHPPKLCLECGRVTGRHDAQGMPHCHAPLPPEPLGWVATRPGDVWYVTDVLARAREARGTLPTDASIE
jgi:hypothetical protein